MDILPPFVDYFALLLDEGREENDKEQKSREEEQKIQEEERAMHLKKEKEKMVFGFETTLSKAKTGRNEVANWLNQSLVEYRVSARLKEREKESKIKRSR